MVDQDGRELLTANAFQQRRLIPQARVGQLRDLKGLDVERPILQRHEAHEFIGQHRAVRACDNPIQVPEIPVVELPGGQDAPFQPLDGASQGSLHQQPGLNRQQHEETGA